MNVGEYVIMIGEQYASSPVMALPVLIDQWLQHCNLHLL